MLDSNAAVRNAWNSSGISARSRALALWMWRIGRASTGFLRTVSEPGSFTDAEPAEDLTEQRIRTDSANDRTERVMGQTQLLGQ